MGGQESLALYSRPDLSPLLSSWVVGHSRRIPLGSCSFWRTVPSIVCRISRRRPVSRLQWWHCRHRCSSRFLPRLDLRPSSGDGRPLLPIEMGSWWRRMGLGRIDISGGCSWSFFDSGSLATGNAWRLNLPPGGRLAGRPSRYRWRWPLSSFEIVSVVEPSLRAGQGRNDMTTDSHKRLSLDSPIILFCADRTGSWCSTYFFCYGRFFSLTSSHGLFWFYFITGVIKMSHNFSLNSMIIVIFIHLLEITSAHKLPANLLPSPLRQFKITQTSHLKHIQCSNLAQLPRATKA